MNDIIFLTGAKLTNPYNTLRTSNPFVRSDTGFVIDSEPHTSRTCKTSLYVVSLAVRVHTGCSAFPFYTPIKVSKGAKIRNRYNQVPHLTQDTNGKVTNSQ